MFTEQTDLNPDLKPEQPQASVDLSKAVSKGALKYRSLTDIVLSRATIIFTEPPSEGEPFIDASKIKPRHDIF